MVGSRGRGLVTAAGAWGVVDPVEHDEGQAANHEDDAHHQENRRLEGKNRPERRKFKKKTQEGESETLELEGRTDPDLLRRVQGHGLDEAKVEGCREDEDEHGGGGGACRGSAEGREGGEECGH